MGMLAVQMNKMCKCGTFQSDYYLLLRQQLTISKPNELEQLNLETSAKSLVQFQINLNKNKFIPHNIIILNLINSQKCACFI